MTTKAEFAVQITCDSCVAKIENSLKDVKGIKNIEISKEKGTVLVESDLPHSLIKEKIESSGRKAVLTGYGTETGGNGNGAVKVELTLEKQELVPSGCCKSCISEDRSVTYSTSAVSSDPSNKESMSQDKDSVNACDSETTPLVGATGAPNTTIQRDSDNENKDNVSESTVKTQNEGDGENNVVSDISPFKKRIKPEYKSDDEEELELRYSSDSDDADFESRLHIFKSDGGEDIWKIDEDEFDVIDADEVDSTEHDTSEKADAELEDKSLLSNLNKPNYNRKRKSSNGESETNEDNLNKPDIDKKSGAGVRTKELGVGVKAGKPLKISKLRRGEFDQSSGHIALQVLIMPDKEEVLLELNEGQIIKNTLCDLVYKRGLQLHHGVDVFQPKFSDCKFLKPGWLFVHCDDKATFDWLLSWQIPSQNGKKFISVPAIDKTPPEFIKFCIKYNRTSDVETMLRLIHLQNREIDTKYWVLSGSKVVKSDHFEQFKFQVDKGSIRALEKNNWAFFYELFTVKIVEVNGLPPGNAKKPINTSPKKW